MFLSNHLRFIIPPIHLHVTIMVRTEKNTIDLVGTIVTTGLHCRMIRVIVEEGTEVGGGDRPVVVVVAEVAVTVIKNGISGLSEILGGLEGREMTDKMDLRGEHVFFFYFTLPFCNCFSFF